MGVISSPKVARIWTLADSGAWIRVSPTTWIRANSDRIFSYDLLFNDVRLENPEKENGGSF